MRRLLDKFRVTLELGGYLDKPRYRAIAGNAYQDKYWNSIAMSDNGDELAAVAWGGHIYTFSNSGTDWTNRSTAAGSVSVIGGNRNWRSIAMSDNGDELAAVAYNGHIYTATNSGATWTWTDRSTQEAP